MCVTVADCVPVYVVDPVRMATALLHAGWRGVAAGVLERGLKTLERCFGSKAEELLLHLGPAICGACYEVGPEVHRALGLPDPGEPAAVDLRGVLAARATATGVDPARITRSAQCTRCGDSPFFSHRRGDPERQVGYLGIRPGVPTSLTEPRPPTPCKVPTEPSAPTVPHGEQ
jgi:polyphenol oxidase